MHHHYGDIRSRIAEPPTWWDENGVPRWGEFTPDAASYIYAAQTVLLLIECQSCETEFKVCMTGQDYAWPRFEKPTAETMIKNPLEKAVREGTLHYGDPPNADCCMAGPTMNSVPRTVLEFWDDDKRRPDLEGIDLTPEWAEDER
jgi:hypothetical protein